MTAPLDRIRQAAGVMVMPAAQPRISPPTGRVGISDVVAARRGAGIDITEFSLAALVAGIGAVVAMFAYDPATSAALEHTANDDLFLYRWLARVLTVGGINTWGPIVAILAVVALVAGAVWWKGLSDAYAPAIGLLVVGGVAAVVTVVPLLVAVVMILLAVVAYVAFCIGLIIAVLALLVGAASD